MPASCGCCCRATMRSGRSEPAPQGWRPQSDLEGLEVRLNLGFRVLGLGFRVWGLGFFGFIEIV